jgi:hypothetical protein
MTLKKPMVKQQDSARNAAMAMHKDPTATEAQQQSSTGKITTNVQVCRSEFHLAQSSSSLHSLLAHNNTEGLDYGVLLPA